MWPIRSCITLPHQLLQYYLFHSSSHTQWLRQSGHLSVIWKNQVCFCLRIFKHAVSFAWHHPSLLSLIDFFSFLHLSVKFISSEKQSLFTQQKLFLHILLFHSISLISVWSLKHIHFLHAYLINFIFSQYIFILVRVRDISVLFTALYIGLNPGWEEIRLSRHG